MPSPFATNPVSIAVDQANNIYVADLGNTILGAADVEFVKVEGADDPRVIKIPADGISLPTIIENLPPTVTFDPNQCPSIVTTGLPCLTWIYPSGIKVDGGGNVYVTHVSDKLASTGPLVNELVKIAPDGTKTTLLNDIDTATCGKSSFTFASKGVALSTIADLYLAGHVTEVDCSTDWSPKNTTQ